MNPKLIAGAAALVIGATIVGVELNSSPVADVVVDAGISCHSYEEQKSEACREYWSAPAMDAGAQ